MLAGENFSAIEVFRKFFNQVHYRVHMLLSADTETKYAEEFPID
jgi:hypothetical protein